MTPKNISLDLFSIKDWIQFSHDLSLETSITHSSRSRLIVRSSDWEEGCNLYGSVLRTNNELTMYYQLLNRTREKIFRFRTGVGYAHSKCGEVWTKPLVGETHYKYGKTNILTFSSGNTELCTPSVVCLEPDRFLMSYFDAYYNDPVGRFKWETPVKIPGWRGIEGEGVYLSDSKDGLHWKRREFPILQGQCDAVNLGKLHDDRIILTAKYGRRYDRHYREIAETISKDTYQWSAPRIVLSPDYLDKTGTEFYGLKPFSFDGFDYGFLWVYRNTPSDKGVHAELVRRDASGNWHRSPSRTPCLSEGPPGSWDAGRVYAGDFLSVSDQKVGGKYGDGYIYYGGSTVRHDDRRYWEMSIGRVSFNPVTFLRLTAGYFPGGLLTKEFVFKQPMRTLQIFGEFEGVVQIKERGRFKKLRKKRLMFSNLQEFILPPLAGPFSIMVQVISGYLSGIRFKPG